MKSLIEHCQLQFVQKKHYRINKKECPKIVRSKSYLKESIHISLFSFNFDDNFSQMLSLSWDTLSENTGL